MAMLALVIPSAGAQGVSSCPALDLSNPNPGDQVSPGDYVLSGVVLNPVTGTASGVSRIDFFLGARDQGGSIVGTTIPSAPKFSTTITFPQVNRFDTLVAYAYADSGATTAVGVPIQIGSVPSSETSPSPQDVSVTVKTGCPQATLQLGSGASLGRTTAPVVSASPSGGPTLQLANPSAEDLLSRGAYITFGVAFDSAATQGAGVDRVDFFLDGRDSGGPNIGSAIPGTAGGPPGAFAGRVTIPNSVTGGHNFVAYAHSAVTGLESVVSVPVFIATRP